MTTAIPGIRAAAGTEEEHQEEAMAEMVPAEMKDVKAMPRAGAANHAGIRLTMTMTIMILTGAQVEAGPADRGRKRQKKSKFLPLPRTRLSARCGWTPS